MLVPTGVTVLAPKEFAYCAITSEELDVAFTFIPVAVTVLFIENHANVDVPRRTAETRSIASAGINFFIVFIAFRKSPFIPLQW